MKISSKIILLAGVLLGFLVCYACISWEELTKIHKEFNEVVREDLGLMASATSFNDVQLKKEILFEKLTSSAEELAFSNVNDSRRQYLVDYVRDLRAQFKLNSLSVDKQLKKAFSLSSKSPLLHQMLEKVQKALVVYDQKVQQMFLDVSAGGYQLSMEDLDQIEIQQMALALDLHQTLQEIWSKVDGSVQRINYLQERGRHILWVSLVLSFIVALIFALSLIRRIHTSLNALVKGVRAIQQGQLGAKVTVNSLDEIGELASAINRMSEQLKDFEDQMYKKNAELAYGLEQSSRQKKELEQTNRDLDRFVNLISHDINGPLSGIVGYSSYLQQHNTGGDPKIAQVVHHLYQSSQRLNSMVKDLLEMTKITSIHRPFEKVDVGLSIKEALQRQEYLIEKTSAMIHLPESFPLVMADRLKLSVVFLNLLGNAIKYSSKEGNKPQVDVTWQKRERDYLFCIQDNGIGIASEHYEEIFNMFKRLSEAESFEGSGVGLAIVKEIIQEHGGQIWVESVHGQGTQFFFTIPIESPTLLGQHNS